MFAQTDAACLNVGLVELTLMILFAIAATPKMQFDNTLT